MENTNFFKDHKTLTCPLTYNKLPKLVEFPVDAIVIYVMTLLPPNPPDHIPRVDDEKEASADVAPPVKPPKLVEFPVEAIVI